MQSFPGCRLALLRWISLRAAGRYDGFGERGLSLWDAPVFCWSGKQAGWYLILPRATRH